MLSKILKSTLILCLLYQNPSFSKSTTFSEFNSKDLSNYFSGIVAFENKSNSNALKFFNLSKNLIKNHDPYLEKYITTLVLEKKVPQAINVVKKNRDRDNINFFDAHLLLVLDSLKKNNIEKAYKDLNIAFKFADQNRFNSVILETLNEYIFVFKEKKLSNEKKKFWKFINYNRNFSKMFFRRCKN